MRNEEFVHEDLKTVRKKTNSYRRPMQINVFQASIILAFTQNGTIDFLIESK